MFGTIGGPELVLILIIALIVFGPRKLPEIGKTLGKTIVEFRKASTEFQRTIEQEIESEKRREAAPAALPAATPAAEAGQQPASETTSAPSPTAAEATVSRETPPQPIAPK